MVCFVFDHMLVIEEKETCRSQFSVYCQISFSFNFFRVEQKCWQQVCLQCKMNYRYIPIRLQRMNIFMDYFSLLDNSWWNTSLISELILRFMRSGLLASWPFCLLCLSLFPPSHSTAVSKKQCLHIEAMRSFLSPVSDHAVHKKNKILS